MAATAQQAFVPPQNYDQKDIASSNVPRSSSSSNATQAEFTTTSLPIHGVVVTAPNIAHTGNPHPTLQATAVTLAVQPIQHTQSLPQSGTAQIIAASVLTSEDFQTNTGKEGFTAGEVQYVEASADHGLYPNGTGSNAFHYNDSGMFSQQPATFMDTAAQPQQAQMISVSTNSAVVTASSSAPGEYVHVAGQQHQGIPRHPIAHTTRASPATVQWLLENYETAEGVSLPRQTLYHHYLTHCQTHKLDPVNAASFGKLIRSVFLGLKTRRLGTRGNSKYHYYGIRIKPNSPLNALTDDTQVAMRQSPSTQKRIKPASRADGLDGDNFSSLSGGSVDQPQQSHHQHQQYLGDVTQGLPDFDDLDTKGTPLPDDIVEDDLDTFQDMYREHCEAFLDVVVNLQFGVVESLWQSFWRHTADVKKEVKNEDGQVLSTSPHIKELGDDEDNEKRLPKTKLMILCEYEPVVAYVKSCDHLLYQTLVEILIPDVLRPIPSSLTQAIRNFAKRLEGWVAGSLNHVPKKMGDIKVSSCCAFAQTLRRYTSLNHLAQAARAVLQNPSQINQMLNDLNRVDFANVQEQAAWVCQCDDHLVYRIEQDFKLTLQQQNSLEQWATWLEGVVDQFLKPHEGGEGYPKAAKQFLLKWSFYSSMIIRDLTLRSAASFGSFHLIRLLYDEYMFYLVEHKVSKAIGASPISVMGEYVGLGSALAMGLDAVENSLLGDQNGDNSLGESTASSLPSSNTDTGEPEAKKARSN